MRLSFSRDSRSEDRFEAWIAKQHQQRVLEGGMATSGPCPDERFLEDLVSQSDQISLSDPRVEHATTCPICTQWIIMLRRKRRTRQRNLVLAVGAASILLIAVALAFFVHQRSASQEQARSIIPISQTLDLWSAGTYRGSQPGQLQSVTLPAGLVKVNIVLPRYSELGKYSVAVTRDQSGHDLIAIGSAEAKTDNDRVEVSVSLDLRNSKPGAYFLSTTHERDQASYYYPLQIR